MMAGCNLPTAGIDYIEACSTNSRIHHVKSDVFTVSVMSLSKHNLFHLIWHYHRRDMTLMILLIKYSF